MTLSDTPDTSDSVNDMAHVIRYFLPAYRQQHKLSPEQVSACQSIIQCQTEQILRNP